MSGESTRATIDAYLTRLSERDLDGAVGLCSDDVVWDVPFSGAVPWSGQHTGHAGVREFFRQIHEHLVPEEFTIAHIVVDGTEGVILGHLRDTVKATGAPLATHFAAHVTVTDGKISHYRLFEDSHGLARALAPAGKA
ncbi:nuclear transport factor 2 family protein [Streptomyces boncukensis]|uniref:Nuclear transport factor 2 family protein n=1 Tax=Streptomyces boncukensis TaxID=2711219 RepID=A0A6G4WY69_9ACTN|nr:nuclear transport factor 2 family protein [Streptomyces boncukensis]NGO69557.1 nuclear transport factor 2 family protein [Streptomyces boncukensis]